MTSRTSHSTSQALTVRAAFAAVLLALGVAAAHAGADCDAHASAAEVNAPSITVRYGDLNLATAEGNHVLLRRITAAAAKVCPDSVGSRLASTSRHCVDEAIARAVGETKSAQLAELLASRGRPMARS